MDVQRKHYARLVSITRLSWKQFKMLNREEPVEWPIPRADHEYVLGFMFDKKRESVVLIKRESGWQNGCFNGIGCEIKDADFKNGLITKFESVTGKKTEQSDWKTFALIQKPGKFKVWCLKSFQEELDVNTRTDELVAVIRLDDVQEYNRILDIDSLIRCALDDSIMIEVFTSTFLIRKGGT